MKEVDGGRSEAEDGGRGTMVGRAMEGGQEGTWWLVEKKRSKERGLGTLLEGRR